MLTPENRRRETQRRYDRSDKGRQAHRKARRAYDQSIRGRMVRATCRLKQASARKSARTVRDRLRELKLRLLQKRIQAAIDAGRLTTYRQLDDGLRLPILDKYVITDPAMIDEFLRDLGF